METTVGSSSKKRKGGVLQRKNAAQDERRTESSLYSLLMVMYAKGELSGAQVHAIAKAGQEDINNTHDGLNVVGLERRTLAAMMAKDSDLPMPMEVHIP